MARRPSVRACGALSRRGAIALVFAALAVATTAHAQQYKQLEPKVNANQEKVLRGRVATILRQTGAPNADDQKAIDNYFLGYYFPTMTQFSPEQLGDLADMRGDLFIQYILPAKSTAGRDQVIGLALKAATSISSGNYHPAVRYNAVLLLGQLDAEPATSGTGGTPPRPLAQATTALVGLVESDDIKGVAVPSAAKVAALVGLDRHTRFGADSQLAERISNAMLAIIAHDEKPEDISDEVHAWMKCQAARVLANQFSKGLTEPVHEAFVGLVGDKKLGLDNRAKVAEMLAAPMYQDARGIDANAMADALNQLAIDVLTQEGKLAGNYLDALLGSDAAGGFQGQFGGGGYGGRGGFGGRGGGEFGGRGGYGGEYGGRGGYGGGLDLGALQPEGPRYEKRRFLDRILAVATGLNAIGAAGKDDVKQHATELVASINRAARTVANSATTDVDVAETVVACGKEVKQLIAGWDAGGAGSADGGDEPQAGDDEEFGA